MIKNFYRNEVWIIIYILNHKRIMTKKLDEVFFREDMIKIIVLNILINEFVRNKLSLQIKLGKLFPIF